MVVYANYLSPPKFWISKIFIAYFITNYHPNNPPQNLTSSKKKSELIKPLYENGPLFFPRGVIKGNTIFKNIRVSLSNIFIKNKAPHFQKILRFKNTKVTLAKNFYIQ